MISLWPGLPRLVSSGRRLSGFCQNRDGRARFELMDARIDLDIGLPGDPQGPQTGGELAAQLAAASRRLTAGGWRLASG